MTGRPRGAPPVLMDDPYADERTAPFWAAAQDERLVCAQCTGCRTFRMPPAAFCPVCRAQGVNWVELPGTGRVYTYTIVRHALRPDFVDAVPFVVAVISLDGAGDARLISNVVGCDPESVVVAMPVMVVWDRLSRTFTFPRFTPTS